MESVQRIMLASPRPEPIGKADEVFLVDRLQHRHDRLLDNLVFQAPDGSKGAWSRPPSECSSAWPVALYSCLCVSVRAGRQFLVEVFSVGLPRHAVDAGAASRSSAR